MTTISIRIPDDVIEDLKELAPAFGFSGYQPLIRAYIGQGMRRHEVELENSSFDVIAESLRKQGVDDKIIAMALEDAKLTHA
jgi:predicted transcriptional regulator